MASKGTTYDKLQRERAKKAKAALKRERRQDRSTDTSEAMPIGDNGYQDNPDDLLAHLTIAHARFEANEINFEEFEELKTGLLERLAALPIDS